MYCKEKFVCLQLVVKLDHKQIDHANAALIRTRCVLLRDRVCDTMAQCALSDINEWFGIGLFWFLNSCHWLIFLIHINECMNRIYSHIKIIFYA